MVAGAQLTLCARVHSLAPAGCPQHLSASNVVPGSVRWTLLNQTLSGATVTVDAAYVNARLGALAKNIDLSKFIL